MPDPAFVDTIVLERHEDTVGLMLGYEVADDPVAILVLCRDDALTVAESLLVAVEDLDEDPHRAVASNSRPGVKK